MNFLTEIRENLNEITGMSIYQRSLVETKIASFQWQLAEILNPD